MKNARLWIVGAMLCTLASSAVMGQRNTIISEQSPSLLLDEARVVYLGNLERRARGIPPLRWNRQLTGAARWYSWDSTENRPVGFCGHQDTAGNWPDYRTRASGYLGNAGAENAFCGYVTPEIAIQGWMNSPGHRANLLDPNSRETGVGYYRRSDGRGYITQDFGNDPVYAPVVIEIEAMTTTTPSVNLYIYDRPTSGGFAAPGAATQMMISNSPCFAGAVWEPYAATRTWTLEGGEGWRQVNVKTRDAFGRTLTVSDTIYLGAHAVLDDADLASSTRAQVTIYNAADGGAPQVQFSAGWLADNSFSTFEKLWGNGERVTDSEALGGSAFRLSPGNGESAAWVWDTAFITNTPMTGYFRLKVNDNTSGSEVARIMVQGGSSSYGPISLRGIDFTAPDRYQEFPLNFVFNPSSSDPFLMFRIWRSGSADVTFDAVSIFSAPQPASEPLTWAVPGGNYRGQGIWLRYVNGHTFSDIVEAITYSTELRVSPAELMFLAARDGESPADALLTLTQGCPPARWQVRSDTPWLRVETRDSVIIVHVDQSGLNTGVHTGAVTITPEGVTGVATINVPVRFIVAEQLFTAHLPVINR